MKTRAIITLLCAGAAGLVWSPRAHSEATSSSPPAGSPLRRTALSSAAAAPSSRPALQTRGRATNDTGRKGERGGRGQKSRDGELVPSLNVAKLGDEVRFTFQLANAGSRRVEVKFANGQTHDIAVLDSTGKEIWRWAEGRMFTEARQYRSIDGGDTLSLDNGWENPPASGKLVAVAILKSSNYPVEHRVEFTLP